VQLAARLCHGVNNNASAIESLQVVLTQRKRISVFTLSAPKNLSRGICPENLFFYRSISVKRPLGSVHWRAFTGHC